MQFLCPDFISNRKKNQVRMYISDKTSDNTQMSSSHVTRWGTNKAAQSIVISTQFDIGVNMLLAWCEHSLWLRDVLCLSLSLLVCATNTKWHNNNRPWMSHCVIAVGKFDWKSINPLFILLYSWILCSLLFSLRHPWWLTERHRLNWRADYLDATTIWW